MQQIIFKNKKQKGSVLLMIAVLVLAIVVATSVGVASLVINQISQSKDVSDSIKAYYAAESGMEKILYDYYKTPSPTQFPNIDNMALLCSDDNLSGGEQLPVVDSAVYPEYCIKLFDKNGKRFMFTPAPGDPQLPLTISGATGTINDLLLIQSVGSYADLRRSVQTNF
jgi:hypothetical protein